MRLRLLCTTLVAVPLTGGLAAPASQDVVQKTALVTVVAEARGPVANLGPRARRSASVEPSTSSITSARTRCPGAAGPSSKP